LRRDKRRGIAYLFSGDQQYASAIQLARGDLRPHGNRAINRDAAFILKE
jgi:hypothetical protein